MLTTLIISALLATAFGVKVEQIGQSHLAHHGSRMMRTRDVWTCKDNADCGGACDSIPCWGGQEDICLQDQCFCVVQNPKPVCECTFGRKTVDTCRRGPVGDGLVYCVFSCDGDTSGNGKCDATQDPCKAG